MSRCCVALMTVLASGVVDPATAAARSAGRVSAVAVAGPALATSASPDGAGGRVGALRPECALVSSEAMLVGLLGSLSGDRVGAWTCVNELKRVRADGSAAVRPVGDILAPLRLGAHELRKATVLARAYAARRPISFVGRSVPVAQRERAARLVDAGLDPELAACLSAAAPRVRPPGVASDMAPLHDSPDRKTEQPSR